MLYEDFLNGSIKSRKVVRYCVVLTTLLEYVNNKKLEWFNDTNQVYIENTERFMKIILFTNGHIKKGKISKFTKMVMTK